MISSIEATNCDTFSLLGTEIANLVKCHLQLHHAYDRMREEGEKMRLLLVNEGYQWDDVKKEWIKR